MARALIKSIMRMFPLLLVLIIAALPTRAIPRIIRDTTAAPVKPLALFYVPNGSTNIALGKPVTASDEKPIIGTLSMITDGNKEASEGNWVEFGPGVQWVQIDLLQPSQIFGIQVWHYFGESRVYRDFMVQVSDDADFATGVRTLHNDDRDNSSDLGIGADKEFYETYRGCRIDTRGKNYQGVKARHVRLYSNGNTSDPQNHYIEVEVVGKQSGAPLPTDIEARRKRGEFKNWQLATNSAFYLRWTNEPSKKLPPQIDLPETFWVPQDAIESEWLSTSFSAQPRWQRDDYYFYPPPPWHPLSSGLQWMQTDLKTKYQIYAIRLWHWQESEEGRVYHDVIVQTADDAKFTKNVRTLFNNDADNSAHLGKGTNKEYAEGPNGLLLDLRGKEWRGVSLRFVRFYSRSEKPKGATQYVKVEFIGQLPPEPIQHPAGRPDLMIWKTKLPMAAYN